MRQFTLPRDSFSQHEAEVSGRYMLFICTVTIVPNQAWVEDDGGILLLRPSAFQRRRNAVWNS